MTCLKLSGMDQPQQCQCPFDSGPYPEKHREWRWASMLRVGRNPDFCNKLATHSINGELLCRRHAADRALIILTEDKEP